MSRCPITYEECGPSRYSEAGLRLLSRRLRTLFDFPYSASEQRREAIRRAGKISIQGVQPKLSARLSIAREVFEIVDTAGRFILKPQQADYPALPENEDLVMKLAAVVGIRTPLHGLMYASDGTCTYFIKRFDRKSQKEKLAVQDFATLAGRDRNTKYDWSVERLFDLLDYCTFPRIEAVELLRRLLFNFLVGNEDMHLKNWAVITRDGKTSLAPAYDYLSTAVMFRALGREEREIEETALPLAGKKKQLMREHWLDYLAVERLGLPARTVEDILARFGSAKRSWDEIIRRSFVPEVMQNLLLEMLRNRGTALGI
jgi:serine/threonine-protein kinase HipA